MLTRFEVTAIKQSSIWDLKIKIAASLTLINIVKHKINNLLHAVNKHNLIKANKFYQIKVYGIQLAMKKSNNTNKLYKFVETYFCKS